MARSLTGSYLEGKFGALAAKIGGNAYHNGSTIAYPGILSAASLSPLAKIPNDHKNEPYSLITLQANIPKIVNVNSGFGEFPAHAAFGDASALEIVGVYLAYGSLSAGTNATFGVLITSNNGGTTICSAVAGGLAPATGVSVAFSNGAIVADNISLNLSVTSITGGTGADYVIDAVVTLICKSKHVA